MRTIRLCLVVLMLAGGLGLGWRWYEDQQLPHFEGRSLRSWFEQECRMSALSRGMADGVRELNSKLAIYAMGTNAVPFLVEQAMSGRQDGAIRKAIQRVLLELPAPDLSQRIVSFAQIQSQAVGLVRRLKPSADMILPRVWPYLHGSNDGQRIQGLSLLGSVDAGAEKVLPVLVQTLGQTKDPWIRATAEGAILSLGSRAEGALDGLLATVDPAATGQDFLRWLAVLGPVASNAVPLLEGIVNAEFHAARQEAVVALLNIRPDHPGAMAVLREVLSTEGSSTPRAQGARDEALGAWVYAPRRPNAEVAALVEPLARLEILTWTANNASYRAGRALERVAPERAAGLYRQALKGPGWVHAAIGLLRVDRDDPQATRQLVEAISEDSPELLSAVLGLREASSSNTEAIRLLQNLIRSQPGTQDGMQQKQIFAEYALARIRHREWAEASGWDELDW
jgi:hypothetical protein